MLSRIRPSGARDFFRPKRRIDWFKPGKLLKYFMATYFMRLCYLERGSGEAAKRGELDPFASFVEPLNRGEMLIYFPQGSRDEPLFQKGAYHLAKRFPGVPIIPMFLEGTRELHPKGVPFWKFFPTPVTVYVGEHYHFNEALSPAENVRALQIYVYNLVTAR
jgi:1-acyl-sn-glycerol-3-phosphate acyltransferase